MACVMCGSPTKGERKTCSEACRLAAISSNARKNRMEYGSKSQRIREMNNEPVKEFDISEELRRFRRSQR